LVVTDFDADVVEHGSIEPPVLRNELDT